MSEPAQPVAAFSPHLRRAFIAGARRAIAAGDELNRINVFPVPDGDPGSHLSSTLGHVLQGALSRRRRHIDELLVRIGNDAIDGARVRLKPLTQTWAMARDISHAVRGGRIPHWAEQVVRFSGLLPIAAIKPDGRLAVAGGLIARKRAPEAFARYVAKRAKGAAGWRLIVGHSDALDDGQRMLVALRERLPVVEAHLVEIGSAVGVHAGPGTLLVGLQPAPL